MPFDSVAIVPLTHRGTVNVVLLAPICQSAANVFSIVFRVFSHSRVSFFAFIILLLPLSKIRHFSYVLIYSRQLKGVEMISSHHVNYPVIKNPQELVFPWSPVAPTLLVQQTLQL
jgi:hypothetical protein